MLPNRSFQWLFGAVLVDASPLEVVALDSTAFPVLANLGLHGHEGRVEGLAFSGDHSRLDLSEGITIRESQLTEVVGCDLETDPECMA